MSCRAADEQCGEDGNCQGSYHTARNLADSSANANGDEFCSGRLQAPIYRLGERVGAHRALQLFHVHGAGLSELVLGGVEAGTVHVIVDLYGAIGEHGERDVVERKRVKRELVR